MQKFFDTEGEEIVEFFLEDESISYRKQEKIEKLDEDYADYRVADFYLPEYKIYVEFLGKWNTQEGKEKYLKKKEIYAKNNIPCVYLYPDNLGILKYVFYMRLKEIFIKHPELKMQFFRYKLKFCRQMLGWIWFGFLISVMAVSLAQNISKLNLTLVSRSGLMILLLFFVSIGLSTYVIKIAFSKKGSPGYSIKAEHPKH